MYKCQHSWATSQTLVLQRSALGIYKKNDPYCILSHLIKGEKGVEIVLQGNSIIMMLRVTFHSKVGYKNV